MKCSKENAQDCVDPGQLGEGGYPHEESPQGIYKKRGELKREEGA